MNPVQRAVDELRFRIPLKILELAFLQKERSWNVTISPLSSMIMDNVVRPRVMIDANLYGGAEALIPLSECSNTVIENMHTVIEVPKTVTQGRSIVSVLELNVGPMYPVANGMPLYTGVQNSSALMNAANAAYQAHGSIPAISTARTTLIGENTILVRNSIRFNNYGHMRCILANDENMSHLQIRSYNVFARLVELAVKSYIYNEMIIEMDSGFLQGGQEFGAIKSIIEGWNDAEEMYQEYLSTKWAKVSMMNDPEGYRRFLKTMIGSAR